MSSPSSIQCGAYELIEPVGSGTVATVWRGRHRRTGRAIAMKVITREKARNEEYRKRFVREAQSHVRMVHPSIVTVYDYGRIDEEAEARSEGELVAGSPYLAMEYTEGGSLWGAIEVDDWPTLRAVMLQVLDGLAYAHARGVVHRDLKPENILWFPGEPGHFKLSDFGIAQSLDELIGRQTRDIEDPIAGTPYYMPTEQLSGDWRRVGPWSDLYALGCVAFEAVAGHRPFDGLNLAEVGQAKFSGEMPAYEERFAVPDEFEQWVRRLMSREPSDRYRCAGDAAWVLRQMPAVDDAAAEGGGASASLERKFDTLPNSGSSEEPTPAVSFGPPPPMPNDWRVDESEMDRSELADSGLEVLGAREIPLVDREEERDALWESLQDVVEHGELRVVELRGRSGAGKTRLATWLAERAHELGVAIALETDHTRHGGSGEGLRTLVERALKVWELDRARTFDRVRQELETLANWSDTPVDEAGLERLAGVLADIARPESLEGSDTTAFRMRSPESRFRAVAHMLTAFGRDRPVVLVLDDLHWSRESVGLLSYLMDRREDLPVLAVTTVRDDALDGSGLESDLAELARRKGFRRIRVGPMEARDRAELVDHLLPLEPRAAQEVLQQAGRLPLFVVQLVRDWLDRGVLERTEGTYDVSGRGRRTHPTTLLELWDERIDQLVARVPGRSESAEVALEVAGVLGAIHDESVWRDAVERSGGRLTRQLTDALVREGMAWPSRGGWTFVDEKFVEKLRERAEASGRWEEYHRHCADALMAEASDAGGADRGRLIHHLLEAGEHERALGPMLEAASYRLDVGEYESAAEVLDRRRAVLDALDVPADARERAENGALRARLKLAAGDLRAAGRLADAVYERAETNGWVPEQGFTLLVKAVLEHKRGDYEAAERVLARADRAFSEAGWPAGRARVARERGVVYRRRGEFRRSREAFERAGDLYGDLGYEALLVDVDNAVGYTWLAENDAERAKKRFQRGLDRARQIGSRRKEARSWTFLGEEARLREDWDEARRCYQNAFDAGIERREPAKSVLELNLAMVEVGARRFDVAREHLEACRSAEIGHIEGVYALAAACLAGSEGVWRDWDARYREAVAQIDRAGGVELDEAWMAEWAGRLAVEWNESDRARRALELATDLWGDIGFEERAARCRRELRRLRDGDGSNVEGAGDDGADGNGSNEQ